MKHLSLAPIVLATFCTFSVAAQQPDAPQPQQQPSAQPAPTAQPSQAATAQPASAQPAEPEALALSPVTGELTSKLDSKTAKAGDKVELKTTEKATMADGTVIPKGTKIMGHVTEAQAYVANTDNGRLTLQFDQAEIKSGQSMPIKSAIQTISPAGSSAVDASAGMPNSSGSSPQASGAAPNGTASQGTGAAAAAGARSATENSNPGGSSAADATSSPAPGTTVARNGNVVIKTTAVPGVLVASSATGQPFSNASGALLSARQDVHLDGGTKVVLAMASSTSPGTGAAQR
jgi:hypothetical protein